MDEKASGRIKDFLSFLRDAKEGHRIASSLVGDADKEIQDILHWSEFNAGASEEDRVKISKAETRVRQERRQAKNDAAILEPVAKWATENAAVVKSLERLQGEVKKAERSAENRHYIDRTDVIARTLGEEKEEGA